MTQSIVPAAWSGITPERAALSLRRWQAQQEMNAAKAVWDEAVAADAPSAVCSALNDGYDAAHARWTAALRAEYRPASVSLGEQAVQP